MKQSGAVKEILELFKKEPAASAGLFGANCPIAALAAGQVMEELKSPLLVITGTQLEAEEFLLNYKGLFDKPCALFGAQNWQKEKDLAESY